MELEKLAQGLADLLGLGTVSHMEADRMGENEQGWSGAKVIRRKAVFADGTDAAMIFKLTGRKERCAMQRLTEQAQCSPACYSDDLISDEAEWMAMEDLGRPKIAAAGDEMWLGKVAGELASIHMDNMGKGDELPWLPAADGAYWQTVVTQLSVDHFERKMEQNPDFNHEFGKYLSSIKEAGDRFAREMSSLSKEKDCLTLTHGDLQMRDGAHIYNCNGRPRIIDFGFCRYAPFYIDLAGWFSAESLKLYYDALSAKGFAVKYADFEERARAAFRYTGFIYLCPSIIDWQSGPTERTGRRLLQALEIILTGDFKERKIHYSDTLFQKLIENHRSIHV